MVIEQAMHDGLLGGRTGKHSERIKLTEIQVGPPPGPSWCVCAPTLRGPYHIERLNWPAERPATPGALVMFRYETVDEAREAAELLEEAKAKR